MFLGDSRSCVDIFVGWLVYDVKNGPVVGLLGSPPNLLFAFPVFTSYDKMINDVIASYIQPQRKGYVSYGLL